MRSILFATAGLRVPGGIANLAGSTLDALDQMTIEGSLDRVDVLSFLDQEAPRRSNPNARTAVAGGSKPKFIRHLISELYRGEPDLVLYDVVGLARATRLPLPRLRSTPYGLFIHDRLDVDPGARKGRRQLLTSARLLIANSTTTASFAASHLDPGAERQIEVVSPTVARDRILQWADLVYRPMSERLPVALIVSRMDSRQPGKGHDTLLRAWPAVISSQEDARLIVVGEGDLRPRLEAMAAELRVREHVDFLGQISIEELGRLYAQSLVFVMPSRQEGFGIVYAEAMWHGLPCIGSRADAAVDVIDDGSTGLLVPFGDVEATAEAIVSILQSPDLAAEMGQNGRRKCLRSYTPDTHRQRLLEVLQSVA